MKEEIDAIFRTESPYALATLFRILGEFDLAEDTLQQAFVSALEKWPVEGIPNNPRAWLISTARNKAIDQIRRNQRLVQGLEVADKASYTEQKYEDLANEEIEDDLLRMIFMCCHPVLSIETQVALTLREVCGLETPEVARAFLLSETTLAQRLVRAKAKLKDARTTFIVPDTEELPSRILGVLRVIYLIFNEGYYASSGETLTRVELSNEAIRLAEMLCKLLPQAEVFGLTALMCFSESRREARSKNGEIVLLEDQDRSLWNKDLIALGNAYLERSVSLDANGYYSLQAAISAEHTNASKTDWRRVVDLYDRLYLLSPSPIIRLNRAVAVAMSNSVEEGLSEISELVLGELKGYGLAHAAQADLLRRLGQKQEAKEAYKNALDLTHLAPEKRFLQKRIDEMSI